MKIILYNRAGCHLCDEAKAVLARYTLRFDEVDIDANPSLVERFGLCVPVVEIDGKVRFRGRIDPFLLARILSRN